jgi:hypothetical protein
VSKLLHSNLLCVEQLPKEIIEFYQSFIIISLKVTLQGAADQIVERSLNSHLLQNRFAQKIEQSELANKLASSRARASDIARVPRSYEPITTALIDPI